MKSVQKIPSLNFEFYKKETTEKREHKANLLLCNFQFRQLS